MLEPIRLVTIHPALVHFTLGALPIMVLAYMVGMWLRSERWTFAGDVAAVSAAAITVGTFAFGCHEELRWVAQGPRRRETAASSRSSSGQP